MEVARVTIREGMHAAAGQLNLPQVSIIGPIVEAAARVLRQMCHQDVTKGKIYRIRSQRTSGEVSAVIAVTGDIAGLVTYSMDRDTALAIAGAMIGEPCSELEELAQSAIAELANIITGQAGTALQRSGIQNDMSPPLLLMGKDMSFSTFNLTRLVIPLVLDCGEFNIDMGIKLT